MEPVQQTFEIFLPFLRKNGNWVLKIKNPRLGKWKSYSNYDTHYGYTT